MNDYIINVQFILLVQASVGDGNGAGGHDEPKRVIMMGPNGQAVSVPVRFIEEISFKCLIIFGPALGLPESVLILGFPR